MTNTRINRYKQITSGELQKGRGTGLGLAISKSIIDLHDGYIAAISQVDVVYILMFMESTCIGKYILLLDSISIQRKQDERCFYREI